VNLKKFLTEIEELRLHELRYSAKMNTFLNQVSSDGTKDPLKSGDWDMRVEIVLPADMAAHAGLLGNGVVRDSDKQFCTNCTCCLSEHTPLCLVKVVTDTTVGALAAAYDMHPDLFLALNSGRDPAACSSGRSLRNASSLTRQFLFQGGGAHRQKFLQLLPLFQTRQQRFQHQQDRCRHLCGGLRREKNTTNDLAIRRSASAALFGLQPPSLCHLQPQQAEPNKRNRTTSPIW
jgi:hypothetical protein